MTKINKLEIKGFKSFANKTELLFGGTINTILGPNGNGKSNVLDALCFVLGRSSSKSMRAEKAAHLIFDGGKVKKPASKGEVHIYFDNQSSLFPVNEKEVKVSRIVSRNGQSKYKINDKTHSRNEVLDLLSAAKIDPNGYNIILQGDITRFVEMSSPDRRKIVEEISGISVYEEKRHKATLELEKVEKKLGDAEIILKERKTHLRELRKDRDQALKFKELKDQVESNKATYIHLKLKKKQEILHALDGEIAGLQGRLGGFNDEINRLKGIIEQKKGSIRELNEEIEIKGEVEQVQLSKEIENLRVQIEKQKARSVMIKDSLSKIDQRQHALSKDAVDIEKSCQALGQKKKQFEKEIKGNEQELLAIEAKIDSFKKKNKLDSMGDIEKDIDGADAAIEKRQEEMQQIRQQQQELLREKDKLEYKIETLAEQVRKVAEIEKSNKSQLGELKQKKEQFAKVTKQLNSCLEIDSANSVSISNLRKELHELQEQKAKLDARRVSTQERIAGNVAVKKILSLRGKDKGIYGTIAQLGRVSRKYSLALEIAAGSRLNSIVVQDDRTAANCIKYLRENKFGVAAFIPLNKIKAPPSSPGIKELVKKSGVHDLCINLVNYDRKYQKAFEYVFGDTIVVEDIAVARGLGIGSARMVTLPGDLAEHSGVMHGGYHHRSNVASFADAEEDKELEKIESRIAMCELKISSQNEEKDSNEDTIISLRHEKMQMEGEIVKLEKTLHLGTGDLDAHITQKSELEKELKEVDKRLSNIQSNVSVLNKELTQLRGSKEKLKLKVGQMRNPQMLAELSAFDDARQKIKDAMRDHESELKNIDLQKNNMLLPEADRIQQLKKGHEKEYDSFKKEMSGLSEKISKDESVLKEKEGIQKKFFSAYKDLFQKRDRLGSEINAAEDKVEGSRDKSRKVEIEANNCSLKRASLLSEISGLEFQMEPLKSAKLLRGKTEDELNQEIGRFEKLLSSMSAVNMKALEIYEQVEVEYNKLVEKREKLLSEKKDVVDLMEEIEGKKTEQFMKTFNEINKNFNEKFESLTNKGKASLHLENEKSPFEGGMGIRINIAGQRYMDIRSLSGGEKTLTALAFYFAVQEHEPHSFYLMDEVDASLDKHNSERLAQLIRQYCKRAQYIVISHNDALISESDHLYGVSMDENGISKVVSLKI